MIMIDTLGDFDIKVQDESILHSIGNQARLLKLFKYFLTFEGRKLLPDRIIEDMCQGVESNDPLCVLRTQISRVRSMFNFKNDYLEPFFEINYIDGYYQFKLINNCRVDSLMMESYTKKLQCTKDEEEVMELCKEVIDLYKGEYLGELNDDNWLIPIRSRFNRLFITSLSRYLQILVDRNMYSQVISICEESMLNIPYEEIIHTYYIEALANIGQVRCALAHYTYYTSKMYNDLGTLPSTKMVSVYKKIKLRDESVSPNLALSTLDNELKDCKDYVGALVCDNFYFKFLYNFKSRTSERNKESVFVGIITLDKNGYGQLTQEEMKSSMSTLLDITYNRLRKGDVITQWNENQVLLMLLGIEEINLTKLIENLKEKFNYMINDEKITLNIKFKKV